MIVSRTPLADPSPDAAHGWRWAPAWVLTFVALWPAPGYAEAVMVLGALAAIMQLLMVRFRGGTRLLSGPAWALTSVMFFAYWTPQLISSFDAIDARHAFYKTATGLRYLPFLWLVASAVANERGRRVTFGGVAIIVAVWTADALLQAVSGTSPLFWGIDQLKQLISGHGMCTAADTAVLDRLSGILGPCNLKLGVVLASLSPFALFAFAKRFGLLGWSLVAAAIGMVILLAGARAAWLTYTLVLLFSGWRLLGWKKLLGVFAFGAAALVVLTLFSPQFQERIQRTAHVLTADESGVDVALSGRAQIWRAATCMIGEHPINGVGARNFREEFPACDPSPDVRPAWGDGPAHHAHQIILEILSETGAIGLLLWLAGAALAWRAWRYATPAARDRARPAMLALGVTVFPFNTHLAFYSTFWGGLTLLLAALYSGSLLARTMTEGSAARCWFIAPLDLLAAGIARLPQSMLLRLGGALTWLLWPGMGKRRRYARINIALCFPVLDDAQRKRLLRDNLRATVIGALELIRAWYAPSPALEGLVEVEGIEHLRAATATGRGVLLFGGHFTPSELCARLLQEVAGQPVHVVVRRNNHRCLEAMFDRARRSRFAGTIAKKDVRGLLRVLSSGGVIAYSADQNFNYQNAFVPFFGIPAATLTATPELAQRGKAVVLPFWFYRDRDGRYTLRIEPQWDGWPSGDPTGDAARYMAELEKVVRQHPEQYLWVHRRFKTRPPGEADVYR